MNRRKVFLEIVLWTLTLLLAWMFLQQGWAKFDDRSGWASAFALWHYPRWFRLVIGALELGAALLLLVRPVAFLGAAIIIAIMLGAMATHVRWHHPSQVKSEVVPLVLATTIFAARLRR
ncbi:MAG TPA: DoxX family protein [Thermoanaerobaculia bacterium]|jgi:uncharacterized membrane protein YphA (DoxX/SURF4 family)